MKKNRAKRNFILLSVLLVVALVFCFVSFSLPNSGTTFKGFFNSIPLSLDFDRGTRAVYEVEKADYNNNSNDANLTKTVNRVQELLNEKYNDSSVAIVDNNKIEIVVPDAVINTQYIVGFIEFSTSSYSEATFSPVMNGNHVKSAAYRSNNGTPMVYIEFNSEGKKLFEETTANFESSGGGTLYIYVDKNYDQHFSAISINETISGGYLPLSGGAITTKTVAEAFASKIESAKLGINMKIIGNQAQVTKYGNLALLVSLIMFALIMVTTCLYFFKKFGQLGFIFLLSSLIFLTISTIILSFLEFMQFGFESFIALSFIFLVFSHMHLYMFNSIKAEFESGKKMPFSFKTGYTKTLLYQMDAYIVIYGFAIVSLLLSYGALKNMALVLLFTTPFAVLISMLLTRVFSKWYLDINPAKFALVNFEKGRDGNNE